MKILKEKEKGIILVGMPFSGKSTLGAHLADCLGWSFEDSDASLCTRVGNNVCVDTLFARWGESYFRRMEREWVRGLGCCATPRVLATGGGLPCDEMVLRSLLSWGVVVWLDTPLFLLARRCYRATHQDDMVTEVRPLLCGVQSEKETRAHLEVLYARRRAFYAQASLRIVPDAEGHFPVEEVLRQLALRVK